VPKVPPARPPVPTTAASVSELRRWSRYLDRTPIETTIIDHVLWAGRDLRWTMFTGTNMAAVIACDNDKHTDHVARGLIKLVRRGWLRRGTNDVGQRYMQLTPKFEQACELANQRHEVRRVLGPVTWEKINGSAKVADQLHELSLSMKQIKYKDRVKAAARAFIDGTGKTKKPTDESSSPDRGIVSSQMTNRHLRSIDGERKSGT
jgi:hypothetical protein